MVGWLRSDAEDLNCSWRLEAIGTGVYQVVKKYNCHEPRCWRVGTHPAAGGQFLLCYRHHPDYRGTRSTHDFIARMHREHVEREAAFHDKVHEIHERVVLHAADDENHETKPGRQR